MAKNKKDFTDHLSDLAEGVASFWTTAYDFGDFLGRISGLPNLAVKPLALAMGI